MGVGDRHSRRTDKSRIATPAIRSIPAESSADDRELDDPFSAWDEDDAGVHRQSPDSQLAAAAQTRMERRPSKAAAATPPASTDAAPPVLVEGSSRRITTRAEPLVDPVAMRDIVLSRARTLDDPLTTRMLAEVTRKRTRSNIAIVPPDDREAAPDEPSPGERPTMKLPPLRLPTAAAADARSESRTATRSHDTLAEQALQPTPPESSDTRATREEIPSPNRRGARRPIARDEPFRK
jgi:hypothetical protein